MIIAKDLVIAYDNETILDGVSFHIKPGELVFITGKSGTGKSSLFRTIYGDLQIKDGFLQVGGLPMLHARKKSVRNLRRQIGVVFQDYQLVNEWTIEKNISMPLNIGNYPKKTTDEQVQSLLKHIKLSHKSHRRPQELSGGEQQRVGVARALSNSPSLILADEPTGNLDEYSAQMVLNLFKSINEFKKTVLIVTHTMPSNVGVSFRHFHIDNKEMHEIV